MSSPSSSTHTGVTFGPPSASRLATCARTFFAKMARAVGLKVSVMMFLSFDLDCATSFTVMNIGAHVRGGGNLVPSLEAGVEIGATSIQIFTQSPRMWKPSQYAPEVLAAFRAAQANHPSVKNTFCHATYLINLASPDKELYEKSVTCLISNLSVGRGMASSGVVP